MVENKQILFQTDFSHCIFGLQLTEKSKIMSFHQMLPKFFLLLLYINATEIFINILISSYHTCII